MKKTKNFSKIFLLLLLFSLCTGCSKDFDKLGRNKETISKYLQELPTDIEKIKEQNVVFSGNSLVDTTGSYKIFNDFYDSVNREKNSSIILATITDEGDFIYYYINYDSNDFYILQDTRNDRFGNYGILEYTGKYLTYEKDEYVDGYNIIISDIEDLTFKKLYDLTDESEIRKVKLFFYINEK